MATALFPHARKPDGAVFVVEIQFSTLPRASVRSSACGADGPGGSAAEWPRERMSPSLRHSAAHTAEVGCNWLTSSTRTATSCSDARCLSTPCPIATADKPDENTQHSRTDPVFQNAEQRMDDESARRASFDATFRSIERSSSPHDRPIWSTNSLHSP